MIRTFESYLEDWWKYTLTVETDKGPLKVKWSDANDLAKWSNMQAALYLQAENSLQVFYEYFPKWYQLFWNERQKLGAFDLPNDAVIVDIGCGVAVIDLLLATYLPKSKFYLIDREGFKFNPEVSYAEDYPQYHSWDPLHDAISTSGFNPNRFVTLTPENLFPDQVDCVTSYFSYCWHYPKEVYWDRILSSLKVGGKLILDVRSLPDRNVIDEISEDMNSEPTICWFDDKVPEYVDNIPSPKKGDPLGGRVLWTRR